MKNISSPKGLIVGIALTVAACLLPQTGLAQQNEIYDGGTNVWDAGITPDWNSGGATWTNGNDAYFQAATNNVTVDGTVISNYMEFDSGVTSATISGGTMEQLTTANDPTLVNDDASGPVTISSQIEVGLTGGDGQGFVNNNSSYTLTLGNIDFDPGYHFQLATNGSGAITLNGDYTSSDGDAGQINFTTTGTYNIAANANFANLTGGEFNNYGGGVVNIDNSTFTSVQTYSFLGPSNGSNVVNIVGAQTINLYIYDSMKRDSNGNIVTTGMATINQSTQNISTWTGSVNQDGTNLTLASVAGGRLIYSGDIGGNGMPEGLTLGSIANTGTVVLASTGGNTYDENDGSNVFEPSSTTAATIVGGTALVENNGAGSAFGGPVNNGSTPMTVNVQSGATLGGQGVITQEVVAQGPTSVLTAGDPGQANLGIAPSIGILTLDGGLTTTTNSSGVANGLTLDFKLGNAGDLGSPLTTPGVDNDEIIAVNLTLNGPITVNFTVLAPLLTGIPYTLMAGTGDWSGSTDPTFNIIAPTGYALDTSYFGTGYDFNNGTGNDPNGTTPNTLTVQFVAVPEPSTYGLLGLGLLAIVAMGRVDWRKAVSVRK